MVEGKISQIKHCKVMRKMLQLSSRKQHFLRSSEQDQKRALSHSATMFHDRLFHFEKNPHRFFGMVKREWLGTLHPWENDFFFSVFSDFLKCHSMLSVGLGLFFGGMC